MTTKHVVADDLLGQVARKQWELNRRVLEGTLDPERLLQSLQQLLEGQSARLPIEDPGFTVSEQVYAVDVQRKGNFEDAVRTRTNLEYFSIYHDPPKCWLEIPNGTGPKLVKLSLALFNISATFGAAITKLETEGYTPADAWDLLAFTNKAPMFRTIPGKEYHIYALGTTALSHFQEHPDKPGGRLTVDLTARQSGHAGKQHARWELCSADLENRYSGVSAGQYVLVRCK